MEMFGGKIHRFIHRGNTERIPGEIHRVNP